MNVFFQICPVQKGNPVISFHVDLQNGFLITGLASGAVDAWTLPIDLGGVISIDANEENKHLIIDKKFKFNKNKNSNKSNNKNNNNNHIQTSFHKKKSKYSKYFCRRLIESDYESVRHIWLKSNNKIVSVVGDRYLREWSSYHAKHSTVKDFHHQPRHMHDGNCKYAQIVAHENGMILYPKYGQKIMIYANLENLQQQIMIKLPRSLAEDEYIMDFDGSRMITKSLRNDGSKLISLFSIEDIHALMESINNEQQNNNGDNDSNSNNNNNNSNANKNNANKRRLSHTRLSKTKVIARDLQLNWILPRAKKDYWGFQLNALNRDRIAYVTNQNILKVYSISKQQYISKLSGHSSYIIAFEYKNDFIISLSNDKCIRVWDTTVNQCLYTRRSIPGQFVPGYLYKITMIGNNIYYSSDVGLFGFRWRNNSQSAQK